MRNILLHIGRHKTGTTAIQHFLWENRATLRDRGWLVPHAGRMNAGHHGFSRALAPSELEQDPGQDLTQIRALRQLRRELVDVEDQTRVVISSEAFQNCRSSDVAGAFVEYVPRVIVYLRNQLDYLPSAYAQRVHGSNYQGTLEEYYTDIFQHGLDYHAFLQDWQTVFPEAFTVRRYDPASIVEDFCAQGLGLPLQGLQKPQGDQNPSLNSLVTEFKRRQNALPEGERPHQAAVYFLLPLLNQRFPAPRVQVPQGIADDILQRCREPESWVAKTYFGEPQLFEYRKPVTQATPELDEDTYQAMNELLQQLREAYPTPADTREARL